MNIASNKETPSGMFPQTFKEYSVTNLIKKRLLHFSSPSVFGSTKYQYWCFFRESSLSKCLVEFSPLKRRKTKKGKILKLIIITQAWINSKHFEQLFVGFRREAPVAYFAVSFNFHTWYKTQKRHSRLLTGPAICMRPFILLNTYQMGVKLLPGRVW